MNPFEGVNTVPFTYCKYVLLGSTVKLRHKRGLLVSEVLLHLSEMPVAFNLRSQLQVKRVELAEKEPRPRQILSSPAVAALTGVNARCYWRESGGRLSRHRLASLGASRRRL